MILVDTSVWISHLRDGNARLENMLLEGLVSSHPFIIGELACGNLKNREAVISLIKELPQANTVDDEEILLYIEKKSIAGKGIGLIDAHLLASAELSDFYLWTYDKRLKQIAEEIYLDYKP